MTPAGHSDPPLHRKLGIKAGSRVLLAAAPPTFTLDDLPRGATVHTRAAGSGYDVIVVFCPTTARAVSRVRALMPRTKTTGALWVAWPKKSSRVETDLDEKVVRDVGLRHRLVDVKVIAVDATWSALKFVRRVRDRTDR